MKNYLNKKSIFNMIARKNNNTVEISFNFDPTLISLVKSLEGRTYDPRRKVWHIPLAGSYDALDRLAAKGFKIEPELYAEVKRDKERAKEAEALAVLPDTEFTTSLPLYPYQKVGAAFIWKIGSGLLGDEVGLGKTIQSLAVCEKLKAEKVLIFTPSAVKWQWASEIEKFIQIPSDHEHLYIGDRSACCGAETENQTDGDADWQTCNKCGESCNTTCKTCRDYKKIAVIGGTREERLALWTSEARFYVANYELLLRDFTAMNEREWDIIIADEATRISNPQAKQSKAIKKLRAKRRIAMTGTPVSNRANEIWNIIDFTNPGAFGNYWSFLQRYCLKNQWGGIFGYQHMDELRGKLRRYMIRRVKHEVLPELPSKIITDIPFELSDEEKALYKRLKKEILFEIEKSDITKMEKPMTISYTLVKMIRLRQLTDSMELLGENKKSSKLEVLRELIQENVENGRKAIVFTQFAEMADILERELSEWKPLKISGKIKEEYGDVVKRFNDDEEYKILIMTQAGQYGLNIQRASVIFHYDQEWSLAKMQQREGRAHRIGQKDTVLVYNLLAKGTIDYYVKKVLHAKSELSNQILGDTPISMENIKDMLKYE